VNALKAIILLFLLSISASAIEQTDRLAGTIPRPGLENLPTTNQLQFSVGAPDQYYIANGIIGTPRVMVIQYQSKINPNQTAEFSNDFINHYSLQLKNTPADFRLLSSKLVLDKFYFVSLQQTFRGIDVWGSHLGIKATPGGKAFLAGGEVFANINLNIMPAITQKQALAAALTGINYNSAKDKTRFLELAILPLIYSDKVDYCFCYVFEISTSDPRADWRAFVDAHTGIVLWRQDIIDYQAIAGDITSQIQSITAYDTLTTVRLPNNYVYADNTISATSNAQGHFRFNTAGADPVTLDAYLSGPYMEVYNQIGGEAFFTALVPPGDSLEILWNDDYSTLPERNAFYHGQIVHDFIKRLDPTMTLMDFQMRCVVNADGSCNAFYTPWDQSINFYREGGGCPNMAQIGDVVYHEWGHGLTDQQYLAGGSYGPDGAMNEGFSDYLAGTISGQPLIGRGFFGPGSYLRNIHNRNRYPDDWTGESHNDGLIIAGALWHLREMLASRPGYVDTLWHFAKYGYGLDFNDYFWDLLAVDDDDGNIQNGTPHANEIFHCFGDLHGIGPGIQISIMHTPLIDSEDSVSVFPVTTAIQSLNPINSGSVVIWYSTGNGFNNITMTNAGGNNWAGQIPNQAFGTTVRYYIEATDRLGLIGKSPTNAPDTFYQFYVGFDTIPPTMQLTGSPRNTINLFGPYGPFMIQAADMHGIDTSSARFHYRVNTGSEIVLPIRAGSQTREYILDSLALGRQLQNGDTIHYWFTCRDLAHYQNTGRLPSEGDFSLAMADAEFIDNFDNGINDWQVVDSGWIWYDRQGYQSNQCLRSNSGNSYSNNMHSLIYHKLPMNFTPYEHIWLQFKAKYVISPGDTCFIVCAHSPGGPWTKIGLVVGGSQWISRQCELTGFAGPGNESIYYGFLFVSDNSGTAFGILVDNVVLSLEQETRIESSANLPQKLSLAQNYPNPFNMHTSIKFELPEFASVTLEIYDPLGRKVVCLIDKGLLAGSHQAVWDGRNSIGQTTASGIYFYKLQVGRESRIRMMSLIK